MDWSKPDYTAIFAERQERLAVLHRDPEALLAARVHYASHPWDFVSDWGMTFDPRKLERGQLANVPFILWTRQVEFLEWLYERWNTGERGLVEKSRDCGVTWLCVGFAVAMWCFRDGFAVGFGSRKEALVDKMGDPDCVFEKLRHFVQHVPRILLPKDFDFTQHSSSLRIVSPSTGSSITGEAGDNIGRGGRKSIYFVDEAAFLEQQETVDKALSQTTNCQIDVSTFNGSGNQFYKKWMRFQGTRRHFVFDWRHDPRKDDAWYARQLEELDEETVAQEIDRDPHASNTDAFIPAKWVAAAIDAHKTLGFEPEGARIAAFDPADVGDAKAVVCLHGSVFTQAVQLPQKSGDITQAIPWAYEQADDFRADALVYDGDGMGSPAMKLAFRGHNSTGSGHARTSGRMRIQAYHGSAAVAFPDKLYGEDRHIWVKDRMLRAGEMRELSGKTNADTFTNYRAQTWTWLRDRFRATYEAVQRVREGRVITVAPELLISIDSGCTDLQTLQAELSRPRRLWAGNGKIKVEAKSDMKKRGVTSPNLADAAVMAAAEISLPTDLDIAPVFHTLPGPAAATAAWPSEGFESTGLSRGGWMAN